MVRDKWQKTNTHVDEVMETYFPTIEEAQNALARERVLADLRTLVRDAENLLQATAGELGERAAAARSRLTLALERAKRTYNQLQERTVAAAKVAARKADAVVREHPYHSVGMAFGLGLLIGVLVTRK